MWTPTGESQQEQEASRRKSAGGRWMPAGDSQQPRERTDKLDRCGRQQATASRWEKEASSRKPAGNKFQSFKIPTIIFRSFTTIKIRNPKHYHPSKSLTIALSAKFFLRTCVYVASLGQHSTDGGAFDATCEGERHSPNRREISDKIIGHSGLDPVVK